MVVKLKEAYPCSGLKNSLPSSLTFLVRDNPYPCIPSFPWNWQQKELRPLLALGSKASTPSLSQANLMPLRVPVPVLPPLSQQEVGGLERRRGSVLESLKLLSPFLQ